MKKITLLLMLFTGWLYAQSDCNNAQSITLNFNASLTVNATGVSGTATTTTCNPAYYTASDITSSGWYTFTPTQDQTITVTSPAPASVSSTDYFPSFSVYDGSCTSLNCLGGSLVTTPDGGATLNDPTVSFVAYANTTYYIAFDNYYANAGLGSTNAFTFDVVSSSTVATLPDAVTTPSPADGATQVGVSMNAQNQPQVGFSWVAATTGGTPDEYEFYLSDPTATDPTQLNLLGSTPNTSVNVTGIQEGETYYWQVVAKNAAGTATNSATWSFTTGDSSIAPDPAANPTPADGATGVVLYTDSQNQLSVDLTWEAAATGGAPTQYEFYLSDPTATDPTQLNIIGNVNGTSTTLSNVTYGTTYYWRVIPKNDVGAAVNTPTWSFTTEGTAGLEQAEALSHTFYTQNKQLFINTTQLLKEVNLYNLQGKQIKTIKVNKESAQIDLSQLTPGVYFARLNMNNKQASFKFMVE